jgi:hypothetical protein
MITSCEEIEKGEEIFKSKFIVKLDFGNLKNMEEILNDIERVNGRSFYWGWLNDLCKIIKNEMRNLK